MLKRKNLYNIKLLMIKILKTIILLLIVLSTSAQINHNFPDKLQKHDYDIMLTFNYVKNGIGILGSYHRLIGAVEISNTKYAEEHLKMIKYELGFKIIHKPKKGYSVTLLEAYNQILQYQGYKLFINPDNLYTFSTELGLIISLPKNMSASLHLDILNLDAKFGLGIKW